jgi:putative ABC transport system substrate-binding protein
MNRRRFLLTSLAGALAAPLTAGAEQTQKAYRIGLLSLGTAAEIAGPQPRSPTATALLRGLRELGYVYGEHFVTEPRGVDSRPVRFPRLAAEIVRLHVDVIVASGPSLSALKQATSTIPIVMGGGEDPVGQGLVKSLGRPGGNVTGLSNQTVEATGKRLELLKQLVPGAELVAVLWDQAAIRTWQAAEAAARDRGWRLLSLEVRNADELDAAIRKATSARVGALLAMGGVAFAQTGRIVEIAARNRLPVMYTFRLRSRPAGSLPMARTSSRSGGAWRCSSTKS